MPSEAEILSRLVAAGWELPVVSAPGGQYVAVRVAGGFASVAIQFPKARGVVVHPGIIGADVTTAQAAIAARHCALNVLAQLHQHVGLHRVAGVVRIDAAFQATPGFAEWPIVLDGASEVLLTAFGPEIGAHARSLMAAHHLPLNSAVVLLDSQFWLRE